MLSFANPIRKLLCTKFEGIFCLTRELSHHDHIPDLGCAKLKGFFVEIKIARSPYRHDLSFVIKTFHSQLMRTLT